MNKRIGYQQGDVILVAGATIPADAKPVQPSGGRFTLALGEHTGHSHTIEAVLGVEMFERDGKLWLRVETEAPPVKHQEHDQQPPTGTIAPDVYEVRRVVEVDPFEDEIRVVTD